MNKIDRTKALCIAFGWQGGTIHQLSKEIGCTVQDLIYGKPKSEHLTSPYSFGWFAGRTCSVDVNKEKNFPDQTGCLDFWLGVADGIIRKVDDAS